MRICVYGAASPTIDPYYIQEGERLGREMIKRGHSLVFGGGGNGMMGAAARGAKQENGYIFGVVPKFFDEEEVEKLCDFCNELVMPDTMRERKQIMEDNSDAFIVTPGGIGTYEEFFEILTLKQLCRHNKPIALYNINGYYDELTVVMKQAIERNFIKENCMELFFITEDLDELFAYIESTDKKVRTVKELKDG